MLFLVSVTTTMVLSLLTVALNIHAYTVQRQGDFLVDLQHDYFTSPNIKSYYVTASVVVLFTTSLFILPVLLLTVI